MEGSQNGGSKPESGVRFRDWALLCSCILWGVSSEQGFHVHPRQGKKTLFERAMAWEESTSSCRHVPDTIQSFNMLSLPGL